MPNKHAVTREMDQTSITVAYSGSAVSRGVMDLHLLLPALGALGTLIEEVNFAINGRQVGMQISVSEPRTGSFEFALDLAQSWSVEAATLFAGLGITQAKQILELVGLAKDALEWSKGRAKSVLAVIEFLAGESPKKVSEAGSGTVRIENVHGSTITVNQTILNLAQEPAVREAASRLTEPLRHEGFDELAVREKKRKVMSIDRARASSYLFTPKTLEPEVSISTWRTFVRVGSVVFADDNYKWLFIEGGKKVWATVKDLEFLAKTRLHKITFSAGDVLDVDLRTERVVTQERTSEFYEVTKVHSHTPGPTQTEMDI